MQAGHRFSKLPVCAVAVAMLCLPRAAGASILNIETLGTPGFAIFHDGLFDNLGVIEIDLTQENTYDPGTAEPTSGRLVFHYNIYASVVDGVFTDLIGRGVAVSEAPSENTLRGQEFNLWTGNPLGTMRLSWYYTGAGSWLETYMNQYMAGATSVLIWFIDYQYSQEPNDLRGPNSFTSPYAGYWEMNLWGGVDWDPNGGPVGGFANSLFGFDARLGLRESVTTTPEPASLLLFGSGLLGVGAFARRRRRN